MLDVEDAARQHVRTWVHLLGLRKWHVTFEVTDDPIEGDPRNVARNDYSPFESHLTLYAPRLRTDRDVEEAVIHELLHLFDHGLGLPPALHRFIDRLERPLRMVRKRAQG